MNGFRATVTLALSAALATGCAGEEEPDAPMEEALTRITVADVGFSTPESVLHDTLTDVYIVSNINGAPLDADGNGFLSTISPEGQVMELRWIDGATEGVELNAPKGMAILGDSLYVADIDCVRVFVRSTGAAAGSICFEGATFLNDLTVDDNGLLYVTDTGMQAGADGFEPSGSAAIYQFQRDGSRSTLAEGEQLGNPNGISFGSRGIFVATFGSGQVYQLTPEGSVNPVLDDPQLDGIVFTPEGGFLYSSWGAEAVYHVTSTGVKIPVVEGVDAPADIGYDIGRERVLVPLFNQNEVWIVDLAAQGAEGGAQGEG